MVGADLCGHAGNTEEELCNRWMSSPAFTPAYRNHNQRGTIAQEPYRYGTASSRTVASPSGSRCCRTR